MRFPGDVRVMKGVLTVVIWILPLMQQGAYAHEGEHRGKHAEHEAMGKLHKLMPMYAQAQSKINEALANGDAATVKNESARILKTIPDLKSAKPHKNRKQMGSYRTIATAFAGDVKKTAELAKAGDFVKAKHAFQSAQNGCNECHEKFRD